MSPRLAYVAVFALVGCQFDPSGSQELLAPDDDGAVADDDGGGDGGDAQEPPPPPPPETPRVEGVLHLPPEAWYAGTAEVALTGGTIDTDDLTLPIALPDGALFDRWPQGGGPDLAVLHVARFQVLEGAAVRVEGDRPLVVIAAGEIAIDGLLDAGARGPVPGPGGSPPASGDGVGGDGQNRGGLDGGGGGGGGNDRGADGGDATSLFSRADGGVGGGPTVDEARQALIGGSGGGLGSGCVTDPGAGGGAVQLSAGQRVLLRGAINAGGGGGGGGLGGDEDRGDCGGVGAGAGGGAGGMIVVQAPDLSLNNQRWVNGGGGGGGGGDDASGQAGADGAADGVPAAGGAGGASGGGAGGAGAVLGGLPVAGTADDDGGGGGGSAGLLILD